MDLSTIEAVAIAVLIAAAILPLLVGYAPARGSRRATVALGWSATTLTVAATLFAAPILIANGQPNRWVAAGVALLVLTIAFELVPRHVLWSRARGRWRIVTIWRIAAVGSMLTGLLCAVGAVLHGGTVGIVGATGAFVWFLLSLWVLQVSGRVVNPPTGSCVRDAWACTNPSAGRVRD